MSNFFKVCEEGYEMANGCGCLLAKQNSSVTYMYIYSTCVLIGFVLGLHTDMFAATSSIHLGVSVFRRPYWLILLILAKKQDRQFIQQ